MDTKIPAAAKPTQNTKSVPSAKRSSDKTCVHWHDLHHRQADFLAGKRLDVRIVEVQAADNANIKSAND